MRLTWKKTLMLFAVSAALVDYGCGGRNSGDSVKGGEDRASVNVVVMEVVERPFEDWGSYSADLRGIEDALLVAPFQGGRVNTVKKVGTRFRAGASLCNIDSEKYGAALKAAQAQVDVTKGDLERAKINVEKGSLGRSAIDGATLAFQNARMALAAAKRAYEDCRCQAPFDGLLVSRSIEKYQTVAPGAPTVRVSRIDRLQAVIAIPETEAFSYKGGMKAEFHLLQHPDRSYEGKIASRDLAVDASSRTVTARITVVNKDGLLRPGMVGRARILRRIYPHAVVIPSTALLHLENGISVMTAENGRARQRLVKTGASAGDSTLIIEGLKPGDTLIVTGAFQVSEGTRIQY